MCCEAFTVIVELEIGVVENDFSWGTVILNYGRNIFLKVFRLSERTLWLFSTPYHFSFFFHPSGIL